MLNRKTILLKISKNILESSNNEWEWSGELEIDTVGNQYFLCRKSNKNELKFLRLTIVTEKSIIYVNIDEMNASSAGYKIINDCKDIFVRFFQEQDKKHINFILRDKIKELAFSWPEPSFKHDIIFEIDFLNPHIDDLSLKINPDKLNDKKIIQLTSKNQPINLKIKMKTYIEGDVKCIRFYQTMGIQHIKERKEQDYTLQFNLNLNYVGFSIITTSTFEKIRKELMYVCFKNIEFMCIQSNQMRTLHLRIKNMQIDNSLTYDTNYPVIMYPIQKQELELESKKYLLDVCIKQDLKNKYVTFK